MTSSVLGLMTSKVFLSVPSTHSLLMNLEMGQHWHRKSGRGPRDEGEEGSQAGGLLVRARDGGLEFDGEVRHVGDFLTADAAVGLA